MKRQGGCQHGGTPSPLLQVHMYMCIHNAVTNFNDYVITKSEILLNATIRFLFHSHTNPIVDGEVTVINTRPSIC